MNTNPFDFIDECQPWPDHPEPAAQTVRDIIEHGATRLRDDLADYTSDAAYEMARAMAVEFFYDPDRRYTPDWVDGACYALSVILSHLSSSMTVDELQELMEDVADDVAPRTGKTDAQLEIEGFEKWAEALQCVSCHHSFLPEGVAYLVPGVPARCVCKTCSEKQPF
jgi:hypothetical protein